MCIKHNSSFVSRLKVYVPLVPAIHSPLKLAWHNLLMIIKIMPILPNQHVV